MTAFGTLPQPNSVSKSQIGKTGVLVLQGFGIKVRVRSGHLEIEDGVGMQRRKMKIARVSHGLKRLVCVSEDGFTTLGALKWLSDLGVPFVMMNRKGKLLFVTGPTAPSDVRLRRAQALAHTSGAALPITRELITRKLKGQEQVARHKLIDAATADFISQFRDELLAAESITSIRLIESQAALAYWSAWRTLPINFPKSEIHRVPDHWRCFGARISPLSGSPRLSINPANAMLNYLYAMLETEARLAAVALGLDPGLGVLHADLANRDSLALDILEPVRAQVDSALLDWLTKQTLRREWFFAEPDGNCRLRSSLVVQLSQTAELWRRAVAPIAEWVAQALRNPTRKPKPNAQDFPTRLTQRRRTEGRGKEFRVNRFPPRRFVPVVGRLPMKGGSAKPAGEGPLARNWFSLLRADESLPKVKNLKQSVLQAKQDTKPQRGLGAQCQTILGPTRKRTRLRLGRVCRPLPSQLCHRLWVFVSHMPPMSALADAARIPGTGRRWQN